MNSRPLTRAYQEVVKDAFQVMTGGSAAARRKTREDIQERINNTWSNIRQFTKGVKQCSEGRCSFKLLDFIALSSAMKVQSNLDFS